MSTGIRRQPCHRYLWQLWKHAIKVSFAQPGARKLTLVLFILLLLVYLVVLPASIIGTEIGLRSFAHISPSIALFAFSFSALESILISVWVHLIQHKTQCKKTPAAGGITLGIVSPLLCCTPLLPTILGFIAILFPSAVSGLGLRIQYTVSVYQTELLLLALVLLLFAITQNARYLVPANPVKE